MRPWHRGPGVRWTHEPLYYTPHTPLPTLAVAEAHGQLGDGAAHAVRNVRAVLEGVAQGHHDGGQGLAGDDGGLDDGVIMQEFKDAANGPCGGVLDVGAGVLGCVGVSRSGEGPITR